MTGQGRRRERAVHLAGVAGGLDRGREEGAYGRQRRLEALGQREHLADDVVDRLVQRLGLLTGVVTLPHRCLVPGPRLKKYKKKKLRLP